MTRTLGRTRASLGLLSAALLAPPWLLLPPRGAAAKHLERRFHRLIASGFGLRPRAYGNPGGAGTMFVANHISWADIVSLAAVVDADFVAKSDVAGYPGLGKLAARTGTIFIDRERRSQAGAQMAAIRERLVSGRRVALFPEGTTSDGRGVLPFRTSLFAAADAARRVQPVTIVYTARGGGPIRPERKARTHMLIVSTDSNAANDCVALRVRLVTAEWRTLLGTSKTYETPALTDAALLPSISIPVT